jgi:GT2 family glycosyltransferase
MASMTPSPLAEAGVAVVLLTLNQRETTLRALESFSAEDRRDARFLVWDNGSTDGTDEAIRERFPGVHVHWQPENLGVAGGRNAAAALAQKLFDPDYLAFVDNDLVITPGYLDALLAPLLRDPGVGQTQAKLRLLDEPERINDGGGCQVSFWRGITRPIGMFEVDRGQYDVERPCISGGGAMMVRADLFQELGGFDEAFNPVGPEDLDFSLRLRERGFVSLFTPSAMAYHEVGHTYGGGRYTEDYARVKARNWIRFLHRHGSPLEKAGFYLLGIPRIVVRLVFREVRRGNVGALVGSVAGLREAFRRRRSAPGSGAREDSP